MIEKSTISIALDNDTKDVEAEIYGPIAVHETHARHSYVDKPPYTVTHIKTGRIMALARSMDAALQAVREFMDTGIDWPNIDICDIPAGSDERNACKAIAAKARG